ncbi:MAG: hypothetical protein LBC80_10555 [Treponema sp.]|nr:hypothetical protein [Treponema sp.]
MKNAFFAIILMAFAINAQAQISDATVSFSADFTTIYTIGNALADDSMKIPDTTATGAYFASQTEPATKNGFYTLGNLHINFNPFPWMEGYFRIYSIDRPGSFYHPLSMENAGERRMSNPNNFPSFTLDVVYGRVNVFEAIEMEMPFELFMKAGRYKVQGSHFAVVSKYKLEDIHYLMNLKTDLTYEVGAIFDNFKVSAATNYMFNEATQRLYNTDGMVTHGNIVLNEYAPQAFLLAQFTDMEVGGNKLNAEVAYGFNVSGIDSGHSAGFSSRYTLDGIADNISLPIGLAFVFHQRNIDVLGKAAVYAPPVTTASMRTNISAALGTGLRYTLPDYDVELNLAGTFNMVDHYYRDSLQIIRLSLDTMVTIQEHFFVGGGFIAGTLLDAQWKTKASAADKEDFDHTFTFMQNFGYEVYGGINFRNSGKFVIGFNQNKGLSLNHMLEARPDAQIKYKQKDTEWTTSDRLVEAGGLYFKFVFRF